MTFTLYIGYAKNAKVLLRKNDKPIENIAYSDADFAADKEDRKLVIGGLPTVDDMPTSWVCKKQGECRCRPCKRSISSVMTQKFLAVRELLMKLKICTALPMTFKGDS